MKRENGSKGIFVHLMVVICVCALLAVYYLAFIQSKSDYSKYLENAKENLDSSNKIISSSVELNLVTVDQMLKRAVDRQYLNFLFGNQLKDDVKHSMKVLVEQLPYIDAMFTTNEKGVIDILFRKGDDTTHSKSKYIFSAKSHFNTHKNTENKDLLLSVMKADDKVPYNRILLSRRIENLEGRFGGLVVAVMNGRYLEELFNSIAKEPDTDVALFLDNGELMINTKDSLVSKDDMKLSIKEYLNLKSENTISFLLERHSGDDLVYYSFNKVKNYPVTIVIVKKEPDILMQWVKTKNNYFAFLVIFFVFAVLIIFLTYLIVRQMGKVQSAKEKEIIVSQAKSDFLAKMSHELRTPLNAIVGFSRMLSAGYFGQVNNDQTERLNDINICGMHLLEFINDILEFSKGDVGKLKLAESNVDISSLVRDSLRIVAQRARVKRIILINNVPEEPFYILADERKIKQILINLLANAIKFTPNGGKVMISYALDRKANISLSVKDTGIGISRENLPKVMELFEQVNTGNEGTGLGLPLCKMFIELHGGTIKLRSEPGAGTEAIVKLSAKRVIGKVEKELERLEA